jgi:hypothetical protein
VPGGNDVDPGTSNANIDRAGLEEKMVILRKM